MLKKCGRAESLPHNAKETSMSVQYKPRDNGRDYVDRTEEFANYATFLMLNMP